VKVLVSLFIGEQARLWRDMMILILEFESVWQWHFIVQQAFQVLTELVKAEYYWLGTS